MPKKKSVLSIRPFSERDVIPLSSLWKMAWARQGSCPQMIPSVIPPSVPEGTILLADLGGRLVGSACSLPLPWDSRMIEIRAGRLLWMIFDPGAGLQAMEVYRGLLEDMKGHWVSHGLQHVSARTSAIDLQARHSLFLAGFEPLLPLLELCSPLSPLHPLHLPDRIEPATRDDWVAIRDIAKVSFVWDRYHQDPHIPRDQADSLHGMWAFNACSGRADQTLVSREAQKVTGFATLKIHPEEKEGRIDLLAVHPNHRGKGIGAALVQGCLSWCSSKADRVRVGTQAVNIPALRLYLSSGFTPSEAFCDHRWWGGDL